ncbi:uncharacterized protein LOC129593764 isoform X2 [Paramacrobiotus metropolitanus]|uniref:uncharacterized protein LOC129593764 isoform X2 n=1 Tax=Paramacrobiotus metropolitanus TaxID=2943436 RepID=UPI002445C6F6|nr:uncharacterized protein LOC129593764 isoform X2 [Paramacrobiotus metropolitanus]
MMLIISVQPWISSGQPASCQQRFPYTILPDPGDIQVPQQIDGVWYKYRQLNQFSGATGVINDRVKWTVVASTVDTITNRSAVTLWGNFARYNMPENKTCQNHFWTGYLTDTGRHNGDVATTELHFVLKEGNGQILYHDYDKIFVEYACTGPKPDGTCSIPVIAVQTRVKPTDLSPADMASFDAVLNKLFAPYCITVDSIPKQPYTDDLPYCPFIDPPACSAANLRGLSFVKNADSSTPLNYGTTTKLLGNECRWPIAVPTDDLVQSYDPTQLTGQWYAWYFLSVETDVNTLQYTWSSIDTGYLPLSNITAKSMWMEYTFLNSSGCQHGYYVGDMGINGQSEGLLGPISQTGDRVILKLNTMYFDGTYAVHYGCIVPDPVNNRCQLPFILIGARNSPLQVNEGNLRIFPKLVGLFAKYNCFVVPTVPYSILLDGPSTSACLFQGGTDCVKLQIQGLQNTAPANSTTTLPPASYS